MLTYRKALTRYWDVVRVLKLCASADFSAEYHKHLGDMFHEVHANLIGAASR